MDYKLSTYSIYKKKPLLTWHTGINLHAPQANATNVPKQKKLNINNEQHKKYIYKINKHKQKEEQKRKKDRKSQQTEEKKIVL